MISNVAECLVNSHIATDVSKNRTALNFKVKRASKSLSLKVLDFLTLHMMASRNFETLGTASHSRRTASPKCSLQIVTIVRNTQSHCVTKAGGTHSYHCALNGQGNKCLEGVTAAYSTSPTQAYLCQETGVIFSVAPS
jgi:hypothetical protein